MKQKGLSEIQMHQATRAARAAATQARQARQPHENALRQLQAGKEPAPREDRARDERRRPDELVIELAGKGRSTDQAQHRSGGRHAEAGEQSDEGTATASGGDDEQDD